LFNDAEQILVIPPDGMQIVDLPDLMSSSNVTLVDSAVEIHTAGDYRVEFMAIMQSASGTMDALIGVHQNGIAVPSLLAGAVLQSTFVYLSVSAIVTLAMGDILDLRVQSTAGGTVLFGPALNASLSVMKISADV